MNAANVKWFSAPWLWAMALILLAGGLAWAQPADEADEGDDPAGVTVEITDVAAVEPDPAQGGDPDAQYRHLLETWKKHNYRQAAALSEAFHKTNPAYKYTPAVLWMAGDSHYKLRQFDKAIRAFNVVIEQQPHKSTLLDDAGYYRAYCTARLGQWDRALTLLDEFLRDFSYHTGYVKKARKLQADVKKAAAQQS
jgi:tetratricopeptide (TPR) repeat protein